MKNFITAKELKAKINKKIVLDVRFDLHDKEYGKKTYEKEHISNSFFIDLDKDIVGEKNIHGGSRPLPKLEKIIEKLESFGVTNESEIVVYDENMITASRAFWMLKYLGHQDVKILDGGYKAWLEENGSVDGNLVELPKPSKYNYSLNKDIAVHIEEVKEVIKDSSRALIECRSYERYLGNNEPFYARPGHIPTAFSMDSKSLLKDGKLKDIKELKEMFSKLKDYKDIVFSCGSAVNASLNYAVYNEFSENGKVYVGSYSDWISYPENEIEIKDENIL